MRQQYLSLLQGNKEEISILENQDIPYKFLALLSQGIKCQEEELTKRWVSFTVLQEMVLALNSGQRSEVLGATNSGSQILSLMLPDMLHP